MTESMSERKVNEGVTPRIKRDKAFFDSLPKPLTAMEPALRDTVRTLGSDPTFYKKPEAYREQECADALTAFGEDGSDPLLVALCVEEATRWSKRRDRSLLGRLKEALTIYDRDLANIMGGISRPTVNAYLQGRLRENFDPTDRRNLRALVEQRIASLQDIRAELL